MANKDRLSDVYSPELIELINKNLKKTGESKLIEFLKKTDSRSSFRKYMFGEDRELDDAIKSIKEFSKISQELNKVSSSKRRYGLLTDIKKAHLQRTQKKDFKRITSAVEQKTKKFQNQQALKRNFTLSKGKKILSLRDEKHMLNASKEYLSDMLTDYMKKGFAEDSKEVKKLSEDIRKNEEAMNEVQFKLFKLKGGDKYLPKEIEAKEEAKASKENELKELKESFDLKLKEQSEQLKELIDDGFDEQSVIIQQLKKDQLETEKEHNNKLQKLQDEIHKKEKELGYLRRRGSGGGGSTSKLIQAALSLPGAGVALFGGTVLGTMLNVATDTSDPHGGVFTPEHSVLQHHEELSRIPSKAYNKTDMKTLWEVSTASVETRGMSLHDAEKAVVNDNNNGISIGRYQFNLNENSGKVREWHKNKKITDREYQLLEPFMDLPTGDANEKKLDEAAMRGRAGQLPVSVIRKITKLHKEYFSDWFMRTYEKHPYLKNIDMKQISVLMAMHNNAPGIIDMVISKSSNAQEISMNLEKHFFKDKKGNVITTRREAYSFYRANPSVITAMAKMNVDGAHTGSDYREVSPQKEQTTIEPSETKVPFKSRTLNIVDEFRAEQGLGETRRNDAFYENRYSQPSMIKENVVKIREKVAKEIKEKQTSEAKELDRTAPNESKSPKSDVQAVPLVLATDNEMCKNISQGIGI